MLDDSSTAERKAFVRSFVKEIKVTSKEVVLSYTIPWVPEKVAAQSEGVLHTVQYGGLLNHIGQTDYI